jgi:GTP-binding protein
MTVTSAKFVKSLVGPDEILEDGIPQIAFVGRSNVGKSSLINSLTNQKGLARTSSFPGHTQEVNLFLVNKAFYFVDLPGYGFAQASKETQERLQRLIYWYLLDSPYQQKKVVLILDAKVGATESDEKMLHSLEEQGKDIIIVANKIDKLKSSERKQKIEEVRNLAGDLKVIPYSSEKKIGIAELANEIFR